MREAATSSGIVRRVQSGDLEIALISPTGSLHTGRNAFTFEFQRGGQLINVGTVRATGNMPMPGMVTPPTIGWNIVTSSCNPRKYQGAFDGFGVRLMFASCRSGASSSSSRGHPSTKA